MSVSREASIVCSIMIVCDDSNNVKKFRIFGFMLTALPIIVNGRNNTLDENHRIFILKKTKSASVSTYRENLPE